MVRYCIVANYSNNVILALLKRPDDSASLLYVFPKRGIGSIWSLLIFGYQRDCI